MTVLKKYVRKYSYDIRNNKIVCVSQEVKTAMDSF